MESAAETGGGINTCKHTVPNLIAIIGGKWYCRVCRDIVGLVTAEEKRSAVKTTLNETRGFCVVLERAAGKKAGVNPEKSETENTLWLLENLGPEDDRPITELTKDYGSTRIRRRIKIYMKLIGVKKRTLRSYLKELVERKLV